MLLALDIGNSNIKAGIWDGKEWNDHWRSETYPVLGESDYQAEYKQVIDQDSIDPAVVDAVAIASVVPQALQPLSNVMTNLFGIEPLIVNSSSNPGIEVKTAKPEQVGADLIAGAVAAYHIANDACIIVDCGTATTIMAVDSLGTLLGGAICNGLKTSVNALIGKTAQLKQIPLEIPNSPVGKNTIQSMQSGLISGHLAMIEGLIDRIKDEIGPAQVVATGGLISVLADHTDYFDFVDPMLVLDGLRLIADRNFKK